jgi:hypothetical protein
MTSLSTSSSWQKVSRKLWRHGKVVCIPHFFTFCLIKGKLQKNEGGGEKKNIHLLSLSTTSINNFTATYSGPFRIKSLGELSAK